MPSDAVDDYWRLLQAGLLPPSMADRVEEQRPSWMRRAECRRVDIADFFPGYRAQHSLGQELCADCEVIAECRFAARDPGLAGTWGGLTEYDRAAGPARATDGLMACDA